MLAATIAFVEASLVSFEDRRKTVLREGLGDFAAAMLKEQDLASMAWSGDALHLDIMRDQLRAQDPEAETLAIYAGDGTPVSKGYVTHDLEAGRSTISQLATHPELQSLGLGSLLLEAIETAVRARNIHEAILGVETSNPRARKLYARLGYRQFKTGYDSWEAVAASGQSYTHKTEVAWLSKHL